MPNINDENELALIEVIIEIDLKNQPQIEWR